MRGNDVSILFNDVKQQSSVVKHSAVLDGFSGTEAISAFN